MIICRVCEEILEENNRDVIEEGMCKSCFDSYMSSLVVNWEEAKPIISKMGGSEKEISMLKDSIRVLPIEEGKTHV